MVAYGGKIEKHDRSRIINPTKDINTFMLYHGIKHTKTRSIWYKAVHRIDKHYVSDYDSSFTYEIGQEKTVLDCDADPKKDCGQGIHISPIQWAVKYGQSWENLSILEVEVKTDDIVLPRNSEGKVRVKKVKVLSEVPFEECGIYGKILAKRRGNLD